MSVSRSKQAATTLLGGIRSISKRASFCTLESCVASSTKLGACRSIVTGGFRGGNGNGAFVGVVGRRGGNFGGIRTFASGAGGGEEVVHEGLKLHATGGWHKAVGETLSGVMWFWVFYRLYHDYEGFLFGHVGHHEHMLHEEEHGDGGGHH